MERIIKVKYNYKGKKYQEEIPYSIVQEAFGRAMAKRGMDKF